MSSLKAKLLLLFSNFRFKGLQRRGAEFSKYSIGVSGAVFAEERNVFHVLCSTQKNFIPATRLYFSKIDSPGRFFFTCYMKLSFTLLHNNNRKTQEKSIYTSCTLI